MRRNEQHRVLRLIHPPSVKTRGLGGVGQTGSEPRPFGPPSGSQPAGGKPSARRASKHCQIWARFARREGEVPRPTSACHQVSSRVRSHGQHHFLPLSLVEVLIKPEGGCSATIPWPGLQHGRAALIRQNTRTPRPWVSCMKLLQAHEYESPSDALQGTSVCRSWWSCWDVGGAGCA